MLEVWLPLNKDLRNQGLKNGITVTGDCTFIATGSPIGNGCRNFTTAQNMTITGLDFSTLTACSISFWMYRSTAKYVAALSYEAEGSKYIFANRNDGSDLYHGEVGTSTKTYIDGVESLTSPALNSWHHYVVTGADLHEWEHIRFNGYSYTGWRWNGRISDVRIFGHVLTDDDVKKLYNHE